MPATYRSTSSAWKTLRGNTTANNRRTCETVSAGAFFFQPELEMPEKEVGQHTREHVMMPSGIFAHLIVVHPQLRFRFLEALFDGPPDPTEPHQETQGRTERSGTEIIPVPWMGPEGPLDEQPHRRRGVPLLAEHDPFAGELVGDGAFGPLRHGAAIPEGGGDCLGECGDRARRWGWCRRSPLGALLAFIGIGMRGRGQGLEPTSRVRRGGHKRDGADTGGAGLPEVWAVPIETICDNIFEGEHASAIEILHHRCS